MELCVGKNIKTLRKAHNLTQEQLAESIGVSFQAVSKWENSIALPDITFVPVLASFFGVTTDELFSYNLQDMQKEVDSIRDEAYKYRESDPKKSKEILEEGLGKYPGNETLLNNLLYVIDYTNNPDETIKIASKLIDKTTESDIKYDAMRFLAYAYDAKGEKDSAIAVLEQIPEIYFTKLSEMAFILTGKAKYETARKQKWISFEMLLQMMAKIMEYYEAENEPQKAIEEIEWALSILDTIKDEKDKKANKVYEDFFKRHLNKFKNL
ncbi:MAG: helix-turn-helix domain-containing protein [Lachnospiraceae bacterium]|nr:helix-turn-helix domain-containing protein [Lachnospiraceae bacterium]